MITRSSTGGRIIQTKTGLIHYGNTDKFVTERTEDSVDTTKYSFSAFNQPAVPTWNGNSRVVNFK